MNNSTSSKELISRLPYTVHLNRFSHDYCGVMEDPLKYDENLPINGGMSFARKLHILSSHWAFVLMSLHLGLHWSMMLGKVRKLAKISAPSRLRTIALRTSGSLIAIYGVYAFVNRKIATYLFLCNLYGFFDYAEPAVFFFIDYLAIMWLCVFVAYYAKKLIQKCSIKKR